MASTGRSTGNQQRNDSSDGRTGDAETQRQWYRMMSVGFEFIVAILFFGGIGWWLDGRFDTSPWLLFMGLSAGFAVGLWAMVKLARKAFKD